MCKKKKKKKKKKKLVNFKDLTGKERLIPCAKGANARLSLIISGLLYQRSGTNFSACSKQLSTARQTNLLEDGALFGDVRGEKKKKIAYVFRACSVALRLLCGRGCTGQQRSCHRRGSAYSHPSASGDEYVGFC